MLVSFVFSSLSSTQCHSQAVRKCNAKHMPQGKSKIDSSTMAESLDMLQWR
jgi:hypothetical protein